MKSRYLAAILLLLVPSTHGEFIVQTPIQPVVAMVGEDVVLECQLIPAEIPEEMEVRWFRTDWSSVVHLFRKGQDQPDAQVKQYFGRTQLFKDVLDKGNVSLLLKKVTVQDNGHYKCFVVSKAQDQEGTLELKVASLGVQPLLKVVGYEGSSIKLSCISERWFPRAQVEWRDAKGQLIPAEQETTVPDSAGLLTVKSSITVSNSASTKYSCVISNQLLGRGREGMVEISDVIFPRTSPWLGAFLFVLFLLLAVIGCSFFYYRRKRGEYQKVKELMTRPTIAEYEALRDKLVEEGIRAQREKKDLLQQIEKEKLTAKSEYNKLLHLMEWDKMLRCSVSVRLDSETANGNLEVIEDGTAVRDAGGWRNVTESAKRFERYPFILGTEGFEAGKHYWEVLVDECPNWDLGMARESVDRKGRITLCPDQGFWCIGQCWDKYEVKDVENKDLILKDKPARIGIFLNYDEGVVSFHNADTKQKLHSASASFTEPIYPFFCPWRCREPLRISPVHLEE